MASTLKQNPELKSELAAFLRRAVPTASEEQINYLLLVIGEVADYIADFNDFMSKEAMAVKAVAEMAKGTWPERFRRLDAAVAHMRSASLGTKDA